MKKLIATILFVMCAGAIAAQDTYGNPQAGTVTIEPGPDGRNELSLKVGGFDLLLGRDEQWQSFDKPSNATHRKRHYGGRIGTLEVGFNGFNTPASGYSIYPEAEQGFMDLNMGRSFHITVNVFTFATSFTRNNVLGFTMGVGLTSNDFAFETPAYYVKADRMIHPEFPEHELKKSKLHTLALHIPIALEINPTRTFFVSAGAYADLLLKSHLKTKFPKEKLHSPYTNFVQAGVTLRIGFRNVYAFGNYALIDLFRDGKGPQITPYSFGLGFGF